MCCVKMSNIEKKNMKKNILLEFIRKYSLNKTIDKARWISDAKNKTLRTCVASETKNLLVDVTLANWDGFGDAEVGVGNTEKFQKEFSGVYGDDVTFVVNYNEDKTRIINLDVLDGENVTTITVSDLDMIAQSAKMKSLPPFNAEILFDEELKGRFLLAKASLPDVDSFTVMMNKKGVLELVIGYSNINSSRSSMKPKTTPGKDTVEDPIHFNAKYFKEILSANSECGDAVLNVSDKGLASVSFTSGDFTCKYYLTPLDQD